MINWFNKKSNNTKSTSKQEELQSSSSSPLNEYAQELLNEYYQIRVNLDQVSLARNKDEFLAIVQHKSFERDVKRKFEELTGLVGGSYAVIDKNQRKAQIYRSSKISDEENTTDVVPCVGVKIAKSFVKDETTFKDDKKQECILKARLIDLMYEAENPALDLLPKEDRYSPWFLQNVPPYQSKYAFEPLPFEKKLRKLKKSNYLYCYTGEVVFHTYAWRWLLKYAQHNGFDAKINLETPCIQNTKSVKQIWSLEHWEDEVLAQLPEYRWISKINSSKKDLSLGKADADSFGDLKNYWFKTIQDYDRIDNGHKYDFLKEWDYLGLSDKSSTIARSVRIALFRYARHILRQLPKTTIEDQYAIPIISEDKDFIKKIEIQNKVNNLIDRILETERGRREPLLEELEEQGEPIYLHFLYRKIIYYALSVDLTPEKRTVRNLLSKLHQKARFPILPSFFQTLLSEDRLPIEHYCFPLAQSFSSPFEANLPEVTEPNSDRIKSANVAVACMNLVPVWAINDKYGLTKNQAFCSDKSDTIISDESAARLRVIQDYVNFLSSHLVDYVFYQSEKERAENKISTAQHYMQAHEVRTVIGGIRKETPAFLLEKIRQYFNIIYGANEDLIELYYSGTRAEEFHDRCDIGSNFKQLVENAFHIAAEIHIVGSWKGERFDKPVFDKKVNDLLLLARVDSTLQLQDTDHLMKADDTEDIAEKYGFYVLFATICAIRNCLKHNRPDSDIHIEFDRSRKHVLIKNFPPRTSILAGKTRTKKLHPGSTKEALDYLIKSYDEHFNNIGPNQEGEYWVTRVPIYKA